MKAQLSIERLKKSIAMLEVYCEWLEGNSQLTFQEAYRHQVFTGNIFTQVQAWVSLSRTEKEEVMTKEVNP